MDVRFSIHNTHWGQEPSVSTKEALNSFDTMDPQLRRLKHLPYIFNSTLLDSLSLTIPGIYTIGGSRQIGKSTFLKQWMYTLMEQGIHPRSILFLTGEVIDDHHSLIYLIQAHLALMQGSPLRFLIVDEITYIKDWDKAIKFLADSGLFDDVIVVLTGSDLVLMQEARMRFPGRRGKAEQIDFHMYPLSFKEFVHLKNPGINIELDILLLFDLFELYLLHGGFLTAINDHASSGQIAKSTLNTYADWIRGDVLKRGKSEPYLKELLQALIKTYGTQVTWNALSHQVSIEHPKTLQEYAQLLESMDALFIQSALLEHKLTAAPKKAKKIFFSDPFIYHAIRTWVEPGYSPLLQTEEKSMLVETTIITHMRRHYPTYYIKAEGEVDVAYIARNQFWPIEIKWTNQLRPKDLKQIQKYSNGMILTKNSQRGSVFNLPSIPIPLFLYHLPQIVM